MSSMTEGHRKIQEGKDYALPSIPEAIKILNDFVVAAATALDHATVVDHTETYVAPRIPRKDWQKLQELHALLKPYR